jgi:serine/threonine protein kinase
MALTSGTKLGPYEIQSPLGAGGMGEVYRARDTRLGRDVAIKVLPQHLSSNTQLNERFEREARTISSLNHPHICTLHDVGHRPVSLRETSRAMKHALRPMFRCQHRKNRKG